MRSSVFTRPQAETAETASTGISIENLLMIPTRPFVSRTLVLGASWAVDGDKTPVPGPRARSRARPAGPTGRRVQDQIKCWSCFLARV